MKRGKRCAFVCVLLGVVLVFGCGVSYAAEKTKLIMWHTWDLPGEPLEVIAAEFEKDHPNVEVELFSMPLEAAMEKAMTALAAGTGADIVTTNNAESGMGAMVRAGLIHNLDPYSEKYGWRESLFSEGVYRTITYAEKGTILGKGHLYGLAPCGEFVAIFYNRNAFTKIGAEIPNTLEELERILAKIKAKGDVPVMLGNLDRWPIHHAFGPLQHVMIWHDFQSRNPQDDLYTQARGYDVENYKKIFDTYTEAAEVLEKWVREGYFVKGFSGLTYDSSVKLFCSGKGDLYMGGTWLAGDFMDAEEEVGVFPWPPAAKDEGMPLHVGSCFTPVGISKASKYPDLAAEFLNFLFTSDFAQQKLVERNMLPSRVPARVEGEDVNLLYREIIGIWNRINTENKMGYYIGYESPTFFDTACSAGQELAGLKITPEQFTRKLMDDYQEWLKELKELRGE